MVETPRNALRLLRERHEDRVIELLRSHGALSRAELARRTGLSRATLSSIIERLLSAGAVVETTGEPATGTRRRGRPPTLLNLNPAGGLALGIDVGRRRIHVSVANVAHDVIAATSASCSETASWQERTSAALELVESLCARYHISLAALEAVGVGVVGPVAETGFVAEAGVAPRTDDDGAPDPARVVHELVEERFGVPAYVDNNTRLAALAEAIWGSGAGSDNVLYVHLSYGVGGGLVLGGHLFSGAFGGAAEFGHVSVDPDGPECPCGGRGCLERYVCMDAILDCCGADDLDHLIEQLQRADADPDGRAHQAVREAGQRLGRVVAAACNVVNPEVVVVGGPVARIGEPLLASVRETIAAYSHRSVHRALTVRGAHFTEDAAALGGIALVLRRSALLAGYPATHVGPPAGGRTSTVNEEEEWRTGSDQ
ncbi:ROK family transcriptional regulator [Jiangella asiatica]|uniref:ROK family transcriptional regulator n=1 Tax=Jiangella asiatica TaxID=2530372 RepID=UPI00193D7300|nr:ROK family transcriptional regulator [Jiangella asiatica]